LSFLPLTLAFTVGVILSALGQSQPQGGTGSLLDATPPPASGPAADVLGSAAISKPSPQKTDKSDTSEASDNDTSGSSEDVQDDTLYRLKTKDALAAGAMGRDEGELTRKPRRRERVSEVESTKQLKTSGTDPKFQGSLLHSSVTSIEDLGQKASDGAGDKETEPVLEDEARFKAKSLVFSQEESNDSKKKKEKSHTKAETSPSPSPSATASASKR
jgi:hypothetical protein